MNGGSEGGDIYPTGKSRQDVFFGSEGIGGCPLFTAIGVSSLAMTPDATLSDVPGAAGGGALFGAFAGLGGMLGMGARGAAGIFGGQMIEGPLNVAFGGFCGL